MTRWFYYWIALIICSFALGSTTVAHADSYLNANYTSAVLNSSPPPAVFWRLVGQGSSMSLSDLSGNNESASWDGQLVTGPLDTDDSSAGQGTISSNSIFGFAANVSVEEWVRVSPSGSEQVIADRHDDLCNWWYGCSWDLQTQWQMQVDATGDAQPGAVTWEADIGGNMQSVTSNQAIDDDQWHYIVGTIQYDPTTDSSVLRVYIDGVASSSEQVAGELYQNSSADPATLFGGTGIGIDGSAIYTAALSPYQIQTQFDAAMNSSESPPALEDGLQIKGTSQVGNTLDVNFGQWAGTPTQITYQWERCDTEGNNCGLLLGQTNSSYVVTADDYNTTLRVVVTAFSSGGVSSVTTASTNVVTQSYYADNVLADTPDAFWRFDLDAVQIG